MQNNSVLVMSFPLSNLGFSIWLQISEYDVSFELELCHIKLAGYVTLFHLEWGTSWQSGHG